MAGVTYSFDARWDVFGQYTYRSVEDGKYKVDLFPANLEVENKSNLIEVGVRYRF
jgi:predicted porin